jgi:hypothetical protein
MHQFITVAGEVHYPDIALIDVSQSVIPTHEDYLALLFWSELLFQPMQFHAKVVVKMYEILCMDNQSEIPAIPSLSSDLGQIDVPSTAHYGPAQSARNELKIQSTSPEQQDHFFVKIGFRVVGHRIRG